MILRDLVDEARKGRDGPDGGAFVRLGARGIAGDIHRDDGRETVIHIRLRHRSNPSVAQGIR